MDYVWLGRGDTCRPCIRRKKAAIKSTKNKYKYQINQLKVLISNCLFLFLDIEVKMDIFYASIKFEAKRDFVLF